MAPAESALIEQVAAIVNVEVAWSAGPRQMMLRALALPAGSTVQDALMACGLWPPPNEPDGTAAGGAVDDAHVGIWGRKAALDSALREGDRVECYRALKVDPKEARRVRYRAHGEKLPKGVHRPKDRAVDLTQSPDKRLDDPAG
jgi:putative ubiquitin-RnfH superfamily antitoxin RatB of RatAB toxin-antitoxin module